MKHYRNFSGKITRLTILALSALGFHRQADANEKAKVAFTYVELEDAFLITPGQSGNQVIQLPNQEMIQVDWADLVVRDSRVYVRKELLPTLALAPIEVGDILEIAVPEVTGPTAANAETVSAIVTALGTAVGTFAVTSSLDDLSSDMADWTTSALDIGEDDAGSDEALDADEDEESPNDPEPNPNTETPPASSNKDPAFSSTSLEGEVNESAENGSTVGITAQATDPEGGVMTYTLVAQDVEGAFAVDLVTGEVRVLDTAALNFETHTNLNITIRATDPLGAFTETQAVVRLLDDPEDTLNTVPINSLDTPTLSSGAFASGGTGEGEFGFGFAGIEAGSNLGFVELHLNPMNLLMHDLVAGLPTHYLTAAPFSALTEINVASLSSAAVTLSSFVNVSGNVLIFPVSSTDFSTETAMSFPALIKDVDRDLDGVAEESYSFDNGTISRLGESGFSQTTNQFDVSAGDILHFADLTGDGQAELILKHAQVGTAQVYQNTGTGFETDPLSETIFSGVDLDAIAGGRALDISVREHQSDGTLSVMIIGEEQIALYDLT